MFNKLLIIDGSYYLNRALSVPQFWNMVSNETRIGGIYGFLRSMYSTIQKFDYFPVVVFDKGLSQHRIRVYPEYKHSPERELSKLTELTEQEQFDNFGIQLIQQKEILLSILPRLGIPVIIEDGFEGDDLIYYTTCLCRYCIICSEDRDMWQLINDNCKVYMPKSNILLDKDLLSTVYHFDSTEEFLLQKVLLGDKSDNIPSCCKGVGEKSVKDFINVIKLFKKSMIDNEYDFSDFNVERICEEQHIPYKKSYNNFSPKQFNINMELIDLKRLSIVEEINDGITSVISDSSMWINPIYVLELFEQYNIKDIDVAKIVSTVANSQSNIHINNSLF